MKTVFVLYMLTIGRGQIPQVTKLDTFDGSRQCYKTANELEEFYNSDKLSFYKAGLVTFMCLEKVQSDGCTTGK